MAPKAPKFTRKDLENMKRVDLQKLCKDFGVKANMKTEAMIDLLIDNAQPAPPRAPPAPAPTATRALRSAVDDSPSRRISSRARPASAKARGVSTSTVVIRDAERKASQSQKQKPLPQSPATRKAEETQRRLGIGRPVIAGGSGARKSTNLGKRTVKVSKKQPEVINEEREPVSSIVNKCEVVISKSSHAIQNEMRRSEQSANAATSQATILQHFNSKFDLLMQSIAKQNEVIGGLKNEVQTLRTEVTSFQPHAQKVRDLEVEVESIRSSRVSVPPSRQPSRQVSMQISEPIAEETEIEELDVEVAEQEDNTILLEDHEDGLSDASGSTEQNSPVVIVTVETEKTVSQTPRRSSRQSSIGPSRSRASRQPSLPPQRGKTPQTNSRKQLGDANGSVPGTPRARTSRQPSPLVSQRARTPLSVLGKHRREADIGTIQEDPATLSGKPEKKRLRMSKSPAPGAPSIASLPTTLAPTVEEGDEDAPSETPPPEEPIGLSLDSHLEPPPIIIETTDELFADFSVPTTSTPMQQRSGVLDFDSNQLTATPETSMHGRSTLDPYQGFGMSQPPAFGSGLTPRPRTPLATLDRMEDKMFPTALARSPLSAEDEGLRATAMEDSPAPMKKTMYGTELADDTRFGDFGRDGIASGSGFWMGGSRS